MAAEPGTFMYDFDEFKWQATLPGREANITVTPNHNPLVELLTADKQYGFVPEGSAFYWEEYDKSIMAIALAGTSSSQIVVANPLANRFAVGDIVQIAETPGAGGPGGGTARSRGVLKQVTAINYGTNTLSIAAVHGSSGAAPAEDDIIRIVGSAVRENGSITDPPGDDALYSTVNFFKVARANSLQEMVLKFSIGTRVTESIVQAMVDTATKRMYDGLEGSVAIGKYDSTTPQGSDTDSPVIEGIEYVAREFAMQDDGYSSPITTRAGLDEFLDYAYQYYPDFDCLFVGQEAMRVIYDLPDSQDRLKYGACACGTGANGNVRKRNTVHWQIPYRDVEVILSQYFSSDLIVAAKKSDLRLMWQAMPELITLPRLNSRYEMLIRCVATLQYMNSGFWRVALLQGASVV